MAWQMGDMRAAPPPLATVLLAFCATACTPAPWGALIAADLATVAVFGRGIGDIGVSAVTGRDCSVVRLDRGQTYCAPLEGPPAPGPFCTRSLGTVDCWADPAELPGRYRSIGDTPPPTPAQDRYRRALWPKALTAN
jgi:hypothetical protein